jgi:RNA-directed DNA polymerase
MMAQQGFEMVRYADDFVILCRSPEDAARALALVQQWTAEAGLKLHPEKTKIVDATTTAFEFLGYRFDGDGDSRDRRACRSSKTRSARRRNGPQGRACRRSSTTSPPHLRGWFEYFKHSHRYTFSALDSGIRMRLRSILRKRLGKQGRGRGSDHHRWPNKFFAERGLYSLKTAYELACQSSSR